ncbi:MAG: TVP38/TMEM64 family protein [Brevinema sp.]
MKKYVNLLIVLAIFGVVFYMIYRSGLVSQLKLENIPVLRERFLALGFWAFFAYFALYVVACLFSLPGLPITILGGAVFGPVLGTIYTVFSASIGMALSFLSARYALRNILMEKFANSEVFKNIDQGVKNEGWRILMITRLVPVFPFSIQNYIYGLTGINFFLFWGLSTLLIIPGSAAYTLSVGAVLDGSFSATNLIYLGIGAICFVLVSFIPKFVQTKAQ